MNRAFFSFFFIALFAACGGSSDSPSGPIDDPASLGAFAVGYSTFTASDSTRGARSLPAHVWYPVDPEDTEGVERARYLLTGLIGPLSDVAYADARVSMRARRRLILFSHGYTGIPTQSTGLMEALASHGFIVASAEHIGNSQESPDDSFDEAAANRVPDISLLIDVMTARNRDPNDAFHNRLDERRVGVVGHSFGGMTALGAAAGWAGAPPDPRVVAICPVSAVVDAELQSDTRTSPNAGFTQEQLESIVVPVMLMGGTEDIDVFPENNQVAFEQLVNAPRVYKVDIIGANHTHFANVCLIGDFLIDFGITRDRWPDIGAEELDAPYEATCGPDALPIEEANRLANLYTVAFFGRHLFGDSGYDEFLTSDFAETEPGVEFSRK